MSIDWTIDRRVFLGGIGGAAAIALVPVPAALRAAPPAGAGELLTDWTIDDMWGVYTRYAEPVGFGRAHVHETPVAVDPVDDAFVA